MSNGDVWDYAFYRMHEAIETMVPATGGSVSHETTLELHIALRKYVDEWTTANPPETPDSPDELDTLTTSEDAPVFELPLPAEYDET